MGKSWTDVGVAILLLGFCAIMLVASYDIEDLGFGGMKPDVWPRFLLWALTGLSVVFLAVSFSNLRKTPQAPPEDAGGGDWARYVNAAWCFLLFLAFLLTLDYLGMLIGGISFTFLLLCALGGATPRKLALHLAVAVLSIGVMWAIFTLGLGVVLPEGQLLRI